MGQRTNLLLQVEGRSGARLNRVYHLQWGYRKYLPMAFLLLLSSRYFKPEKTDYPTFMDQFQEISIFERKRKPLKSSAFKLYLRTMRKVVKLYESLLNDYLTQRTFDNSKQQ